MKLSTLIHWISFSLVFSSLLLGCASTKTESRPSPLASDSTKIGSALVKITYSSPGVKKRKIWGNLVPYDRIWRTGANQATYLSTTSPLLIEGNTLPEGNYSIFTIPGNTEWTIIFNKDWDQWGAYNYDVSKDAIRINVVPLITEQYQERMKFSFSEDKLNFHWEFLTFSIPLQSASLP